MLPDTSETAHPVICFGPFRFNRQLRSLQHGEQRVRLAPKPLATLEFLIRHRHRVVAKTEILREVWSSQQDINTVEQAVRQVRRVLGDDVIQPRYIETVPGQGYRFIADVNTPTQSGGGGKAPTSLPSRRRLLYMAIGAPLVGLAGFAVNRSLQRPHRVAKVTLNGSSLAALSANGTTLWTHEFHASLQEPPPEEATWRTQVVDLDGDGVPEILVVATRGRERLSISEQLFCFSSGGKELWRYEPKTDVEFGTPDMKGPWKFQDVLVTNGDRGSLIWVAVVHSFWWPSFIVRLSPTGIAKVVFVNPGNIRSLRGIESKSGSYILAAGVNNGYRRAFVAMLAEEASVAKPPEAADPMFRCVRACPTSWPNRYILLPQSEVGAATLPYNIGVNILGRPGGLTIQTQETLGGDPGGAPSGFFYFSHDLNPEGVAYADGYRQLHESLEKRGRITHTFKDCPEQKSPAIVEMYDEDGHWTRVPVPRVPPS